MICHYPVSNSSTAICIICPPITLLRYCQQNIKFSMKHYILFLIRRCAQEWKLRLTGKQNTLDIIGKSRNHDKLSEGCNRQRCPLHGLVVPSIIHDAWPLAIVGNMCGEWHATFTLNLWLTSGNSSHMAAIKCYVLFYLVAVKRHRSHSSLIYV